MKGLAGRKQPQNSSVAYDFVMAGVTPSGSGMDEPAVFGQICRFLGYGQAGTGFALLMR
jgi:hypothetical protein